MLEALDYYGSEKARYDLHNKESELKMAASSRHPRLNSAMDFLPYQRSKEVFSVYERKNTVASRFGITGYNVRDIGIEKAQLPEAQKRERLLNKLGICNKVMINKII
jgi:hypothetical protein